MVSSVIGYESHTDMFSETLKRLLRDYTFIYAIGKLDILHQRIDGRQIISK